MKKDKFLTALLMTSCLFSVSMMNVAPAQAAYTADQEAEIKLWTDYIKDYANDAFGYLNRANISYVAGEYTKALEDYDAALAIDKYNTEAYVRRANAKYMLNDLEGALKDYAVALEINPSLSEARFNVGRIFYRVQNYAPAIENMRLGVKLDAKRPEYYFELARAEYKAGLYAEAQVNFANAISLKSDFLDAYYGKGLASMNLAQYEDAINCFDTLIQSGQKYENAHYYKGLAEYQLGKYDLAIADFDIALEDAPEDGVLYNYRGKAKELLGNKFAAKRDYKKAKKFGLTTVGLAPAEVAAQKAEEQVKNAAKEVVATEVAEAQTVVEEVAETVAEAAVTEAAEVQEAVEETVATEVVETQTAVEETVAEAQEVVKEQVVQTEEVAEQVVEQVEEVAQATEEVVEEVAEVTEEVVEEVAQEVVEQEPVAFEVPPITPPEQIILDEAINRRLAHEKIAEGDVYGAVALFDTVVSDNPTEGGNYLERAELKLKLKDYDGILRDADLALKMGSDRGQAYFYQGIAYEGKNNLPLAYRAYAYALRFAPENPEYRYRFANMAYNVGRFAEAEEVFSVIIEDNALDYPESYLTRAKSRYYIGEFYSAIADAEKYLELQPKCAEAYFYSAMSKDALKQYADAVADFSQAIKYDKDNTTYYLFRAKAYTELGEYQKVSNDYKKIVLLKKENATTEDHLRVAQAEILNENDAEALLFLDIIISKDKLNDNVYLDRARLLSKMGRKFDAINSYSAVLQLNPAQKVVYKERGMLYVDTKSYRKAILDLDEALKLEPNNGTLYYYRALARQVMGDKEGALEDFDMSKRYENL